MYFFHGKNSFTKKILIGILQIPQRINNHKFSLLWVNDNTATIMNIVITVTATSQTDL